MSLGTRTGSGSSGWVTPEPAGGKSSQRLRSSPGLSLGNGGATPLDYSMIGEVRHRIIAVHASQSTARPVGLEPGLEPRSRARATTAPGNRPLAGHDPPTRVRQPEHRLRTQHRPGRGRDVDQERRAPEDNRLLGDSGTKRPASSSETYTSTPVPWRTGSCGRPSGSCRTRNV